jgi:hypothetical protein
MSGSPRPSGSFNEELLFPDDIDSPLPGRPRSLSQPIATKSSAVAPAGPSKPKVPGVTIFDPSRIKIRTSREAFAVNPYSSKGYSLPRKPTPARTQGPYMPGGRHRTKKSGRRRKAGRTAQGARKSRRRRV